MPLSKPQLLRILLVQEIRNILLAPPLWGLLVILSMLVGYSFIQAVSLFSQASQTALTYPELASGMNPLEGIFVPTFGAYYLIETLLLPFIILRLIGHDKQNGTLKILLQLPLSTFALNGVKLAAMAVVWLLLLVPAIAAVANWLLLGGVIYYPEILTLFLGHSLYALTIICIAMFATAVSKSLPTAAMICLSVTLGCWVLDFAVGSGQGWLGIVNSWSLTTLLHQFESSLLSLTTITNFLILALLFFIAAAVWLHPGRRLRHKIQASLLIVTVLLLAVVSTNQLSGYMDVTENQRHSFNPADVRALRQMNKPLTITIHLAPGDGRYYDFNHEVLSKLKRIIPDLRLIFADTASNGLFSASGSDTYGLIEYQYAGQKEQSYSNSPEEILPLLHKLAGQKVTQDKLQSYSGHPLIADASGSKVWFYLLLPLLFLLTAGLIQRPQLCRNLGNSSE